MGQSQRDEVLDPILALVSASEVVADDLLTCFDHNSSKSTIFSASRLSLERSRGDKAVGALKKDARFTSL